MPKRKTRTEEKHSRGSPSSAFGEHVARTRTKRGFTRRQFVFVLHDAMTTDDPMYHKVSESWLGRLENGDAKRQLPDLTIMAIAKALRCTGKEQTDLLLYAGRNVLTQEHQRPTHGVEVLNYVTHYIYQEAQELLAAINKKAGTKDLDELEMLEIIHDILSILIERRRT